MSKSMVWTHFEPTENGAQCKVVDCRKAFVRNADNSTKAYWSHLKHHHPVVYHRLKTLGPDTIRQRREDRPHLCSKCQLHGIKIQLKNHVRICPFMDCDCEKCDRLRKQRSADNSRRRMVRSRCRFSTDSSNDTYGASSPVFSDTASISSESAVSNSESGHSVSSPSLSLTCSPSPELIHLNGQVDCPSRLDFERLSAPLAVHFIQKISPLLLVRLVPPEIGLDFDPLQMARLWNNVRQ